MSFTTSIHNLSRSRKTLLILMFVSLLWLLATSSQQVTATDQYDTTCHTIDYATGLTTPYKSFGSPSDLVFGSGKLLMQVTCNDAGQAKTILGTGDQKLLIYQYGFERVDGRYKKIKFTGVSQSGEWLLGTAEAVLSKTADGQGAVFAYMCKMVGGVWKCGCRDKACTKAYWQRQDFQTTPERTTIELNTDNNDSNKQIEKRDDSTSSKLVTLSANHRLLGSPGTMLYNTTESLTDFEIHSVRVSGKDIIIEAKPRVEGDTLGLLLTELVGDTCIGKPNSHGFNYITSDNKILLENYATCLPRTSTRYLDLCHHDYRKSLQNQARYQNIYTTLGGTWTLETVYVCNRYQIIE